LPRLRDLISIDEVPNIFKFQIFVFTLLTGWQVILELLRTGNFPVLDENLLALMGISGGIYIANELVTDKLLHKVEDLIKEIDKKKEEISKNRDVEANQEEVKRLKEKVRDLLKKIYEEPETK